MKRKTVHPGLLVAGLMLSWPVGGASAAGEGPGLSPAQRGALAGDFVRKWGIYVERVYAMPVADWAMRMVPTFVHAQPDRFRQALVAPTFDAALADLDHGMPRSPGVGVNAAKLLGASGADLVFTPLTPCRIVDTRVAGGPIAAGQSRAFNASAAAGSGYAAQGGSVGDCGSLTSSLAGAVVLNVTSVGPSIAGYTTVYPYGESRPLTASVNYGAGDIVNNTVVTRIPSPPQNKDFSVYSLATSDYVIDIVGYYAAPVATALDTRLEQATKSIGAGSEGYIQVPLCATGYSKTAVYCSGALFLPNTYLKEAGPLYCVFFNGSSQAETFSAYTQCARVPGR